MGVPGGGSGGQAAQDPIGALQNLARQGIFKNSASYSVNISVCMCVI